MTRLWWRVLNPREAARLRRLERRVARLEARVDAMHARPRRGTR